MQPHPANDASPGFALARLSGRMVGADQAYCDLLGFTLEELCDRSFQDFTFPGDLSANLDELGEVVRSGRPATVTKRYIRADGGLTWVRAYISIVRTPDGQGWLAVACTELRPPAGDDFTSRVQYC